MTPVTSEGSGVEDAATRRSHRVCGQKPDVDNRTEQPDLIRQQNLRLLGTADHSLGLSSMGVLKMTFSAEGRRSAQILCAHDSALSSAPFPPPRTGWREGRVAVSASMQLTAHVRA